MAWGKIGFGRRCPCSNDPNISSILRFSRSRSAFSVPRDFWEPPSLFRFDPFEPTDEGGTRSVTGLGSGGCEVSRCTDPSFPVSSSVADLDAAGSGAGPKRSKSDSPDSSKLLPADASRKAWASSFFFLPPRFLRLLLAASRSWEINVCTLSKLSSKTRGKRSRTLVWSALQCKQKLFHCFMELRLGQELVVLIQCMDHFYPSIWLSQVGNSQMLSCSPRFSLKTLKQPGSCQVS